MKKTMILLLAALLLAAALSSCGAETQQADPDKPYANVTLRLAMQYGMQYAPVYVMQQLGLLEAALPGIELQWLNLGGGSAMNEGLISGSLDVAFMGIPPALIAMDAGAAQAVSCAICVPPAALLVRADSAIRSLADITEQTRIAVPSIGSIQHIMLAMAAQQQLGDAQALDDRLIAMSNPDAYAALSSGQELSAHFASQPYLAQELADGCVSILTADDCLAGGASIVCVTAGKQDGETLSPLGYLEQGEEIHAALVDCLAQAIQLINDRDPQTLAIIAQTENISAEQATEYLDWPGTGYSTEVYGLTQLGEFMAQYGYLKNDFPGFAALCYDTAAEYAGDGTPQ